MREDYLQGMDRGLLIEGIDGRGLMPWKLKGAPALVIVDMQPFFADPSSPAFLPSTVSLLPRITALAEAFRANGLPVIFTIHRDSDGPMKAWWGRSTDDGCLAPSIIPKEGEEVLVKEVYDAFHSGVLEPLLRSKTISTLVIVGVCAHLCVESTARTAFCHGFQVIVPVDCVASQDASLHRGALRSLAHGFAHLTDCEELLTLLEAPDA